MIGLIFPIYIAKARKNTLFHYEIFLYILILYLSFAFLTTFIDSTLRAEDMARQGCSIPTVGVILCIAIWNRQMAGWWVVYVRIIMNIILFLIIFFFYFYKICFIFLITHTHPYPHELFHFFILIAVYLNSAHT